MNPDAKRIEASVLMCDMRGFTSLVDTLDPVDAMKLATSVMSILGRVVEDAGGTVDKFMGDGLLAHFGVDGSCGSHVEQACNAALMIKESEQSINATRYGDSLPVISMGIGICTGPLAVGMIKTKTKSELSIFGDTVNMAARIENLTRLFQVDILLCTASAARVAPQFKTKAMAPAKLRGKQGDYVSHWLLPFNTPSHLK